VKTMMSEVLVSSIRVSSQVAITILFAHGPVNRSVDYWSLSRDCFFKNVPLFVIVRTLSASCGKSFLLSLEIVYNLWAFFSSIFFLFLL
jgi:hypothetical protein